MSSLDEESPDPIRRGRRSSADDVRTSPDGIYSGMTKRLAISDDEFVRVQNMPGDSRKTARPAQLKQSLGVKFRQ